MDRLLEARHMRHKAFTYTKSSYDHPTVASIRSS
jgi:hypothetical protein